MSWAFGRLTSDSAETGWNGLLLTLHDTHLKLLCQPGRRAGQTYQHACAGRARSGCSRRGCWNPRSLILSAPTAAGSLRHPQHRQSGSPRPFQGLECKLCTLLVSAMCSDPQAAHLRMSYKPMPPCSDQLMDLCRQGLVLHLSTSPGHTLWKSALHCHSVIHKMVCR